MQTPPVEPREPAHDALDVCQAVVAVAVDLLHLAHPVLREERVGKAPQPQLQRARDGVAVVLAPDNGQAVVQQDLDRVQIGLFRAQSEDALRRDCCEEQKKEKKKSV